MAGIVSLSIAGCTSSKTAQNKKEPVIETIGNKPVYTSEFEYVYNKNNGTAENAYTRASVTEYLDLYTNFRLKVMEAESRGMDTTTAFKRELEGYKQQLAQPYLTEKSVTDQLVKEAYNRMQKEVNASHILITLPHDAEPKDTLAAYNQIMALRERILKGEDFGAVAAETSQDPSARENQGNLGYFTALQMVYPFEDAAYNTPAGQISMPVRTRFGYHIIKVHQVRPAQGEVKVAHIMVRANAGIPQADSVAAKQKIDEIYRKLTVQKEDWNKLVSQFSDDNGSVSNGGELPWFGTGRMIPSFEEAAFGLKNKNDISKPIHTPYGWHIIKMIDRRGLPPYEDMEQSLRNKVAKDSRSELNKTAFLKRIKAENKFTEMKPAKEYIMTRADSSLVQGRFSYNENDKSLQLPLFTIQNQKYTVKNFFDYIKNNGGAKPGVTPAHYMQLFYDKFVETSLIDYEKANLESKYQDYRMLVKEYRDGILLFQLMDEKVWSKAIEDTTGLKVFFEQNKEKYKWDTRAEATIISAANKDVLAKAQQQLQAGRFPVNQAALDDILFETGKDELTNDGKATLEGILRHMKADTTATLEVFGHNDAREATGKNAKIAEKRAQVVAAYLTGKGIPANRIKTASLGKTKQAGSDKTEAGRKQNRRVSMALYSRELSVLENNLNQDNPLAVQIQKRKFQKGDNKALDAVNWQPGTYTVEQDGRIYQITISQILPPSYKTLSEARGVATSDYQSFLEKEWLKNLRQQYPVTVNQAEVEKLIRK